jgi:hypothetical protein
MRKQVLVCISVYGNVFLDGSLLLLFLDLSRLECCDFVHKFEYASLVIMAPVIIAPQSCCPPHSPLSTLRVC